MASTAYLQITATTKLNADLEINGGGSTGSKDWLYLDTSANLEWIESGGSPTATPNMTHNGNGTYISDTAVPYGIISIYDTDTGNYLIEDMPFSADDIELNDLDDVTVTGSDVHFDNTVNIQAETFESEATTGAPITVASTDVCSGLNADQVDGADVGSSAGDIPVLGATGTTLSTTLLGKDVGTGNDDIPQISTSAAAGKLDGSYLGTELGGTSSGDGVDTDTAQDLENKTLKADTTYICDQTDPTKKIQFDVSNVTAGTTPTLIVSGGFGGSVTFPNPSGTNKDLVDTTSTQNISGKTITFSELGGDQIVFNSGDLIVNTSGNEVLEFLVGTPASAVNHIKLLTGLVTGSSPEIQAVGDDTHLNITLKGQGSSGHPILQSGSGSGAVFDTTATSADRTITIPNEDVDLGDVNSQFDTSTGHDHDGTNSKKVTASDVTITDSGSYYAGTNVEAALQEIAGNKVVEQWIDFTQARDDAGNLLDTSTTTPVINSNAFGSGGAYYPHAVKWAYTDTGGTSGIKFCVPIHEDYNGSTIEFDVIGWKDNVGGDATFTIGGYLLDVDGSSPGYAPVSNQTFTVDNNDMDKYTISVTTPDSNAGKVLNVYLYLSSVTMAGSNIYLAGATIRFTTKL